MNVKVVLCIYAVTLCQFVVTLCLLLVVVSCVLFKVNLSLCLFCVSVFFFSPFVSKVLSCEHIPSSCGHFKVFCVSFLCCFQAIKCYYSSGNSLCDLMFLFYCSVLLLQRFEFVSWLLIVFVSLFKNWLTSLCVCLCLFCALFPYILEFMSICVCFIQ